MFFLSLYIWFFILFVDSSGMDFRSMLKKKKYAKWGNDDEGLYVSPQTMLLFCYWLNLSLYVTSNSHQPIFLCNRHQLASLRTGLGRPQAPRQARRARPQRGEAGEFFLQYFCRNYFLSLFGRNLFQESFIIKLMERNSNICQY